MQPIRSVGLGIAVGLFVEGSAGSRLRRGAECFALDVFRLMGQEAQWVAMKTAREGHTSVTLRATKIVLLSGD